MLCFIISLTVFLIGMNTFGFPPTLAALKARNQARQTEPLSTLTPEQISTLDNLLVSAGYIPPRPEPTPPDVQTAPPKFEPVRGETAVQGVLMDTNTGQPVQEVGVTAQRYQPEPEQYSTTVLPPAPAEGAIMPSADELAQAQVMEQYAPQFAPDLAQAKPKGKQPPAPPSYPAGTPPSGTPPATPPAGATPAAPPAGTKPPAGATPATPPVGATPATPPALTPAQIDSLQNLQRIEDKRRQDSILKYRTNRPVPQLPPPATVPSSKEVEKRLKKGSWADIPAGAFPNSIFDLRRMMQERAQAEQAPQEQAQQYWDPEQGQPPQAQQGDFSGTTVIAGPPMADRGDTRLQPGGLFSGTIPPYDAKRFYVQMEGPGGEYVNVVPDEAGGWRSEDGKIKIDRGATGGMGRRFYAPGGIIDQVERKMRPDPTTPVIDRWGLWNLGVQEFPDGTKGTLAFNQYGTPFRLDDVDPSDVEPVPLSYEQLPPLGQAMFNRFNYNRFNDADFTGGEDPTTPRAERGVTADQALQEQLSALSPNIVNAYRTNPAALRKAIGEQVFDERMQEWYDQYRELFAAMNELPQTGSSPSSTPSAPPVSPHTANVQAFADLLKLAKTRGQRQQILNAAAQYGTNVAAMLKSLTTQFGSSTRDSSSMQGQQLLLTDSQLQSLARQMAAQELTDNLAIPIVEDGRIDRTIGSMTQKRYLEMARKGELSPEDVRDFNPARIAATMQYYRETGKHNELNAYIQDLHNRIAKYEPDEYLRRVYLDYPVTVTYGDFNFASNPLSAAVERSQAKSREQESKIASTATPTPPSGGGRGGDREVRDTVYIVSKGNEEVTVPQFVAYVEQEGAALTGADLQIDMENAARKKFGSSENAKKIANDASKAVYDYLRSLPDDKIKSFADTMVYRYLNALGTMYRIEKLTLAQYKRDVANFLGYTPPLLKDITDPSSAIKDGNIRQMIKEGEGKSSVMSEIISSLKEGNIHYKLIDNGPLFVFAPLTQAIQTANIIKDANQYVQRMKIQMGIMRRGRVGSADGKTGGAFE